MNSGLELPREEGEPASPLPQLCRWLSWTWSYFNMPCTLGTTLASLDPEVGCLVVRHPQGAGSSRRVVHGVGGYGSLFSIPTCFWLSCWEKSLHSHLASCLCSQGCCLTPRMCTLLWAGWLPRAWQPSQGWCPTPLTLSAVGWWCSLAGKGVSLTPTGLTLISLPKENTIQCSFQSSLFWLLKLCDKNLGKQLYSQSPSTLSTVPLEKRMCFYHRDKNTKNEIFWGELN